MTNPNSAIIYHNHENTTFIIDTPSSITLAQQLSSSSTSNQQTVKNKRPRILVSSLPREQPYPNTEPKTESARSKVLARSSLAEQRFHHEFIQPIVQTSLEAIRAGYQVDGSRPWCLDRHVPADDKRLPKDKSRKRKATDYDQDDESIPSISTKRPLILSSTSNTFDSISDLSGMVKNTASECASVKLSKESTAEYLIPPLSTFVLCTLPLSEPEHLEEPIPGLPAQQKFNLLLFDPPWPNRSVRRSRDYQTHMYYDMNSLTQRLQDILQVHAYDPNTIEQSLTPTTMHSTSSQNSIAAIWITNSEKARKAAYAALLNSGFRISEEWIWIKVTTSGEPISPLNGLWKKPYEILVIGQRGTEKEKYQAVSEGDSLETDLLGVDPGSITRRVIAGVPDLHSRKPNLRWLFEQLFFAETESKIECSPVNLASSYSALEVFARNLTAGWYACGNEVLKFNARECWVEEEE
ncbi:hypothetical protein N7495_006197 [Penicillium taxi]|uniref:uncharacterized protein n=1 Tax=Penicillium taxi TaxID=168475 RepID=UPI002545A9C6|nr:uncharacterized protein N7495_006197 [Penicillium taxi]KAJ5894506.1 hypothetical protein N7495_006197 [Penicillium taxi]